LIVEENAAASIHLQIYEAWGQEDAGRKARLRPIGRNLAPGPNPNDAASRISTAASYAAVTVKNTVRQDGMPRR